MVESDGRNLIFILSTPRAGSTLLAAILGSHPDIFAPPEPWVLLPLVALTHESAQIIAPYDHQLARHAVHAIATPATLSRAMAAYATTIYNTALDPTGKRIFVDKTPRYYHLTAELDAMFPRATKIWMLRNPLDVVASCRDTWKLPLDEILGDVISPHSFDATVAFRLLASYFARQSADQVVVRYEDLTRDATAEVHRLCERLTVPFDSAMLDYKTNATLMERYASSAWGDKTLFVSSRPEMTPVGRWRSALSPADIQRTLTTLGTEIFEILGYATELHEAATVAGVAVTSLARHGRLGDLMDQAQAYAVRHLPPTPGGLRTLQVKELTELRAQLDQERRNLAAARAAFDVPLLRWLKRLRLWRALDAPPASSPPNQGAARPTRR